MERFVSKNGVPKNGFPIVFSKSDLVGGGTVFSPTFFSEKAKHPGIGQSFGGNVGETQFCHLPIIPTKGLTVNRTNKQERFLAQKQD